MLLIVQHNPPAHWTAGGAENGNGIYPTASSLICAVSPAPFPLLTSLLLVHLKTLGAGGLRDGPRSAAHVRVFLVLRGRSPLPRTALVCHRTSLVPCRHTGVPHPAHLGRVAALFLLHRNAEPPAPPERVDFGPQRDAFLAFLHTFPVFRHSLSLHL